ncbi:MAG: DUF6512 family protein [Clostridia bacterium]|nr:DUF6512 family protein [Clostridia bacterium]
MKKHIFLWQIFQFVFVSIFGIVLHFLYDWTESGFIAMFSAVNESTWEHMKLIFFPMLLFAWIQKRFIGDKYTHFWCLKLRSMLVGLMMIPILFYTLRGIFGNTPDWINIAVFFVAVSVAIGYETKQFLNPGTSYRNNKLCIFMLCLIAICFAVFTFAPPKIPLFQDPMSRTFGI